MKPLIIIAICLPLGACNLDKIASLDKPSDFQRSVEARQALIYTPSNIAPEPTPTAATEAPIVSMAAVETCTPEWRQWSCDDAGRKIDWVW